MRRIRLILIALLVGLLLGGYLTLRGLGLFGPPVGARAKSVPEGDQEIAWINPATSGSTWERFVAGIRNLRQDYPGLVVEDANAFPEQTTAVPEVALRIEGCPHRLWIRWYKLTSEAGKEQWVEELSRRSPAPLALVGGGSSDRARDLAQVLAAQKEWRGKPPLFLLMTATADELFVGEQKNQPVALMKIYPERTFRFCFTNRQMADAVRDLVWTHPFLRPVGSPAPGLPGLATIGGDFWAGLGLFAAEAALRPNVRVVEWEDDPYSLDLSNQFRNVLQDHDDQATTTISRVAYSVGDYYLPNRPEAEEIAEYAEELADAGHRRQVLVIPAVEKPARRILRGLSAAAPKEVRNVVAVTGDSISFNVVYRDREIAWNIQDMPVPLVFFCHQNPAAWREEKPVPDERLNTRFPNATDDELLNADIIRVLLDAAFVRPESGPPQLLTDPDALAQRLHDRQPAFFDADGNRKGGSGEYVVCLRPHFDRARVLPHATLEVWSRSPHTEGGRWRLVRQMQVEYGEGGGHGAL